MHETLQIHYQYKLTHLCESLFIPNCLDSLEASSKIFMAQLLDVYLQGLPIAPFLVTFDKLLLFIVSCAVKIMSFFTFERHLFI